MRHAAVRAPLVSLALLAAASAAAPADAQESPVAEVPRQRTGPDANPLPLPSYQLPLDLPAAPSPPQFSPVPAPSTAVAEVRVEAANDGSDAVPPPGWQVPQEEASGFLLDHRAGEPLSAEWVRRQFTYNSAAGPGVTLDRPLALVQLINRAFASAGFVNSGIIVSPQQPGGDVLALTLIYGALIAEGTGPITIEWGDEDSRGLSAEYVRARMPSALDQPLNAVAIERDFRLLAEDPAIRTINADLRPGSRPGEASLHLTVFPEERYDFYLLAANSRSPSVGGERFAAGGSMRNLLASGDVLSGEFGLTEGVEDGTIGYSTPFLDQRTSLSFRGSFNDAAVVEPLLVPLDITSRDRAAEIGITHYLLKTPLTPTRTPGDWTPSRTLSVGALLAYRHSKSFLLDEPFSFAPGTVDGVSEYGALRLLADYLVRDVDHVFAASLTLTVGLDGTQSDVPGIPNPKDHFLAALMQLNFAQRLNSSGLELRARVAAQISNSVLYSGERFSLGGENSVRGYRETLLLTDHGIAGSIELAQPFSLSGRDRSVGGFDWGAFSIAAFLDAGTADNAELLEPVDDDLVSVGASLSWTPSPAILARISYAESLKDVVPVGRRDLQDRGIHFRVIVYPLRLFWNR